jgi:hypothetical protein
MGDPRYRGGSGEPLLLLHGSFYTWRAWETLLNELECFFEVLAPTPATCRTIRGAAEGAPRFPRDT